MDSSPLTRLCIPLLTVNLISDASVDGIESAIFSQFCRAAGYISFGDKFIRKPPTDMDQVHTKAYRYEAVAELAVGPTCTTTSLTRNRVRRRYALTKYQQCIDAGYLAHTNNYQVSPTTLINLIIYCLWLLRFI